MVRKKAEERSVTSLKTAAKETRISPAMVQLKIDLSEFRCNGSQADTNLRFS